MKHPTALVPGLALAVPAESATAELGSNVFELACMRHADGSVVSERIIASLRVNHAFDGDLGELETTTSIANALYLTSPWSVLAEVEPFDARQATLPCAALQLPMARCTLPMRRPVRCT